MAEWDVRETRALGLDPRALLDICYSGDAPSLQAQFTAPGAAIHLARVDGVVAGCAGFSAAGDGRAELEKVFVRPAFRGLGIGRALLSTVLDGITAQGYANVRLETAIFMTDAIATYARFGFTPCPPFRDPMPGLEIGSVFMSRAV
jgi:GNAT superfamily N-acetyltransferase